MDAAEVNLVLFRYGTAFSICPAQDRNCEKGSSLRQDRIKRNEDPLWKSLWPGTATVDQGEASGTGSFRQSVACLLPVLPGSDGSAGLTHSLASALSLSSNTLW